MIGWHLVFPFFYFTERIEFPFPGAQLIPFSGIVCVVMHDIFKEPSDQQTHQKMICSRTKSDSQSQKETLAGSIVKNDRDYCQQENNSRASM